MKCSVRMEDTGLRIRIDEVPGQERVLLEAMRQCRPSAWACPSGACMNIGTMEGYSADGSVFLSLTPRPEAQLDPVGIEECMRYMLQGVVKL
jgi:hypothetical protein